MTTPLLFVVSDPVLRDQLNLVKPYLNGPVTIVDLATLRRGVWDFPKLIELRRTLAAHQDGTVHALGLWSAKVIAVLGLGLKFAKLRLSGDGSGSVVRVLNRDFSYFAWPWSVPEAGTPVDREEFLSRYGIPADAIVFASSSRFFQKLEALPPIWGFEVIRYPRKDVWLLIHGDGPKASEIWEFAQNLAPEGSRVRLVGDGLPLASVFGIADAVITMNAESLMAGLTARKAMIAPLQFADLLRDNEDALLMDPTQAPMVAKKMMRIVEDKQLRDKLAKATEPMVGRYAPANSAKMLEISRW